MAKYESACCLQCRIRQMCPTDRKKRLWISKNLRSEGKEECSHFIPDGGFMFGDLNSGAIINNEALYVIENRKVRFKFK